MTYPYALGTIDWWMLLWFAFCVVGVVAFMVLLATASPPPPPIEPRPIIDRRSFMR